MNILLQRKNSVELPFVSVIHRYLKKSSRLLKFMCRLLALPFPRAQQGRRYVPRINLFIFRCLCSDSTNQIAKYFITYWRGGGGGGSQAGHVFQLYFLQCLRAGNTLAYCVNEVFYTTGPGKQCFSFLSTFEILPILLSLLSK